MNECVNMFRELQNETTTKPNADHFSFARLSIRSNIEILIKTEGMRQEISYQRISYKCVFIECICWFFCLFVPLISFCHYFLYYFSVLVVVWFQHYYFHFIAVFDSIFQSQCEVFLTLFAFIFLVI